MAVESWEEFANVWLQRDVFIRLDRLFSPTQDQRFAAICLHAELVQAAYLHSEPRVREAKLAFWLDECAAAVPRHPLLTFLASNAAAGDRRGLLTWLERALSESVDAHTGDFWARHDQLAAAIERASTNFCAGLSEHGVLLRAGQTTAWSAQLPLSIKAQFAGLTVEARAAAALQQVCAERQPALKQSGVLARLLAREFRRIARGRKLGSGVFGQLFTAWRARRGGA